jgi:hypothetical protein
VSPEALVLGLLSAVRGVPLAIVYSLLLTEHPRRLLLAYLAGGVVVTLGVGIVVVTWLHTGSRSSEATTGRLVVDLVLGAVAVLWALVRLAGRELRPARPRRVRGAVVPPALESRLRAPTVPLAAAAGVVTNLPGLYYLAALVAILQTHPSALEGIAQVLVYTLLRFVAPVAALLLVALRPDRTLGAVQTVQDWGRRHARVLLAVLVGAVGVYLLVKALSGLLA